MDLCEADGKLLLRRYGIGTPDGTVLNPTDSLPAIYEGGAALKAQMLAGGRSKQGLVLVAREAVDQRLDALREKMTSLGHLPVVLCESLVSISAEYYLAIAVNNATMQVELMFSLSGGIEVESNASGHARKKIDLLRKARTQDFVEFFREAGLPAAHLGNACRLACKLHQLMGAEDATLVEINPLAVTVDGKLIAADAKVVLEDSAGFRHPERDFPLSEELRVSTMNALQQRANKSGFTYVELPGSIVMITAGAGLGMLMMDLLADADMSAATFFENSVNNRGETAAERLRLAFDRARDDDIEAIVFYQTLATRNMKPRVEAIARLLEEAPPPKPFYFGIAASHVATQEMSVSEALTLIAERGITVADNAEQLIELMAKDKKSGAWNTPAHTKMERA